MRTCYLPEVAERTASDPSARCGWPRCLVARLGRKEHDGVTSPMSVPCLSRVSSSPVRSHPVRFVEAFPNLPKSSDPRSRPTVSWARSALSVSALRALRSRLIALKRRSDIRVHLRSGCSKISIDLRMRDNPSRSQLHHGQTRRLHSPSFNSCLAQDLLYQRSTVETSISEK